MSAARRSRGSGSRGAPPPSGAARLTARGAIAILFIVSILGIAIAEFSGESWASGLVFVIGCLAVSMWVRPSDTPMLVVAPPIVYFLALVVVEAVRGLIQGMFVQVAAIGIALNLSEVLFWLLGGTLMAVVILLMRGLPTAWADLRDDLRGGRGDGEPEPAPYAGDADHGRPAPRRSAPPYGGGQPPYGSGQPPYPGQRPRPPAPAPGANPVPPRPQRPPQLNAPRPEGPPRGGYQPRQGGYGYPPQPGGYR